MSDSAALWFSRLFPHICRFMVIKWQQELQLSHPLSLQEERARRFSSLTCSFFSRKAKASSESPAAQLHLAGQNWVRLQYVPRCIPANAPGKGDFNSRVTVPGKWGLGLQKEGVQGRLGVASASDTGGLRKKVLWVTLCASGVHCISSKFPRDRRISLEIDCF